MKQSGLNRVCDIPRPYSRTNCVKNLRSVDDAVLAIVKPKNLRNNSKHHMEMWTPINEAANNRTVDTIMPNHGLCVRINQKFLVDRNMPSGTHRVKEHSSLNLFEQRALLSSISKPENCTRADDNLVRTREQNKFVNKFKCRALEIAYNTFNRKQIKEKKKKHKGFKNSNNHDERHSKEEIKEEVCLRRMKPVSPLSCKQDHLKSIECLNKLKDNDSKDQLKTNSDDESKISIMVSSLGHHNSRNHICDIYSVNTSKRSSPKLIFRKSKKVDVILFQKKATRRTRNINKLQIDGKDTQQGIKIISKSSKDRLILPSISSRVASEIRQRKLSVHI